MTSLKCRSGIQALVAFVLLCSMPLATWAASLTGTYGGDSRQAGNELLFFTIIQDGNNLNGTMLSVTPDGRGGTSSRTLALTGSAPGDLFILKSSAFGTSLVMHGTSAGGKVSITYAAANGQMITVILEKATEAQFNAVLTSWRNALANAYNQSQRTQADRLAEDKRLTELSVQLQSDISVIENSSIPADVDQLGEHIASAKKAVSDIRNDLAHLKKDASVVPMTCYQAFTTVDYDFKTAMAYNFGTQLNYDVGLFKQVDKDLSTRLNREVELTIKLANDSRTLEDALKVGRFGIKVSTKPGDEIEPLKKYRANVETARAALKARRAELGDIVQEAKDLMEQGKAVMEAAQSQVRCK